jgi:Domain of unknown function (DUF697)
MGRAFRTVVLVVGGGALLSAGVLVVNQTAQVVQLAATIHPNLGTATLWTLVSVYAAAVGVPLVLYVRLPSRLVPPASEDDPEFESHIRKLGDRLATSLHLAGRDLSSRRGVEEAIAVLGVRADDIVREAATTVFLSTAVSQSGRLDGLLVIAAQSRMVWRIAHLYGQRPTPRELARLYAAVAGTVFVAAEIDDLDLQEQVEPILSSAMGALGASLPGFQVAGTILANCVLSGSANAFLTLRVGMVAKRCCGATVVQRRSALRRAATAEAAGHLGRIVSEGTSKLTGAIWKASVGKVGDAVTGASGYAKDAGSKLWAKVSSRRFEQQPDAGWSRLSTSSDRMMGVIRGQPGACPISWRK